MSLCEFLSTPSGWRATMDGSLTLDAETQFLSTPSGWRATGLSAFPAHRSKNFYPRPPGGGRRPARFPPRLSKTISIHALRVEGDVRCPAHCSRRCISIHALRVEGDATTQPARAGEQFLSTPSGWRATRITRSSRPESGISIHALRVEGDLKSGKSAIYAP